MSNDLGLETVVFPGAPSSVTVPVGHRIPEGATFYAGEDDGHCRVIRPGEVRCRAGRMPALGLCSGHAGVATVAREPALAGRLAGEKKRELRRTRMLLGITPRSAADPRQLARMRAQERAEEIARALIDEPLDDTSLRSDKRQAAVIAGLEQAFPRVSATLAVDMPSDEQGFEALGWDELRQLERANLQPLGLEPAENPSIQAD